MAGDLYWERVRLYGANVLISLISRPFLCLADPEVSLWAAMTGGGRQSGHKDRPRSTPRSSDSESDLAPAAPEVSNHTTLFYILRSIREEPLVSSFGMLHS